MATATRTSPLPALRDDDPPRHIKASVGYLKTEGRKLQDRKHFVLAKAVEDGKPSDKQYAIHQPMMKRLFDEVRRRELRHVQELMADVDACLAVVIAHTPDDEEAIERLQAERDGHLARSLQVAKAAFNPAKFKPRIVPIMLSKDEPAQMLKLELSRWRAAGPECQCTRFRPMLRREIAEPSFQEALKLQGYPTDPTDEDVKRRSVYWRGESVVTHYDAEANVTGTSEHVCSPLTCPHFDPADKDTPPCRPTVEITFLLDWAPGEYAHAWFASHSWHSAGQLKYTLEELRRIAGPLSGVKCLLVATVEPINTPFKKQNKTIVCVAPDHTFKQLRADAAENALPETRAERAKSLELWRGENQAALPAFDDDEDDDIPTSEGAYYAEAIKLGFTRELAESVLFEVDGDTEDAMVALQARNGGHDE